MPRSNPHPNVCPFPIWFDCCPPGSPRPIFHLACSRTALAPSPPCCAHSSLFFSPMWRDLASLMRPVRADTSSACLRFAPFPVYGREKLEKGHHRKAHESGPKEPYPAYPAFPNIIAHHRSETDWNPILHSEVMGSLPTRSMNRILRNQRSHLPARPAFVHSCWYLSLAG
jgi:hypothetical protein